MKNPKVTTNSFGSVRSVESTDNPTAHTKRFDENSILEFKRRKERASDVSGGVYTWCQDSLRDRYRQHERRVDAADIGYFASGS